MAARALARARQRARMALIGNGAQSEFQALAFHATAGHRGNAPVYDVDAGATAKLVRNLAGLPVAEGQSRCACTAEAVRGADIVTTVTADKAYATIITPEMIEPGMHVNGVGGDCPGKTELHADVLRAARGVRRVRAADAASRATSSRCRPTSRSTELWRVLAGDRSRAAQRAEQVTVFDSVGFALEDYSTLRYVHAQAESAQSGHERRAGALGRRSEGSVPPHAQRCVACRRCAASREALYLPTIVSSRSLAVTSKSESSSWPRRASVDLRPSDPTTTLACGTLNGPKVMGTRSMRRASMTAPAACMCAGAPPIRFALRRSPRSRRRRH